MDPLAEGMWDCMSLLRGPFGNSKILKVLAYIVADVFLQGFAWVCLSRYF